MLHKADSANFLASAWNATLGNKVMFFSVTFMYTKKNLILSITESSIQTLENLQAWSEAGNAVGSRVIVQSTCLVLLGPINSL